MLSPILTRSSEDRFAQTDDICSRAFFASFARSSSLIVVHLSALIADNLLPLFRRASSPASLNFIFLPTLRNASARFRSAIAAAACLVWRPKCARGAPA